MGRLAMLGGLMMFALGSALAAEDRLNRALNEQIVFVKNDAGPFSTELETTIFKPEGDGPFPLVVINHGKSPGNARLQSRYRAVVATRQFVRRGYVVMLPMRGGFSRSSGNYLAGGCDIAGNGLAQADDVRSALDDAVRLPYVDRQRMIVIGQSHGGLATMAFGTVPYPGVLGLINFAGGLRQANCNGWENKLAAAFGDYGASNRFPTLWFYGDNDSYWSATTIAQMFSRFTGAGGKARLVSFGVFKSDSHKLFADPDGLPIWWPEVEKFLAALGLPTKALPPVSNDPATRALLDAAEDSPVAASEVCRRLYLAFIDADYPRAFAVSENGHCGYAWGGEQPNKRAIANCRGKRDSNCVLYAVDDELVGSRPVRP